MMCGEALMTLEAESILFLPDSGAMASPCEGDCTASRAYASTRGSPHAAPFRTAKRRPLKSTSERSSHCGPGIRRGRRDQRTPQEAVDGGLREWWIAILRLRIFRKEMPGGPNHSADDR